MPRKPHLESPLAVTLPELRAALAEGWTIDAPVSRQQPADHPDHPRYCDVILWREGRVRVLTLRNDAALRSFLAEQGFSLKS